MPTSTIAAKCRHLAALRRPVAVLAFVAWLHGSNAAAIAQSPGPLPCVRAPVGDSEPWVHNGRVLQSFPPDVPPPRFLGRFATGDSQYELHLWRDSVGIFGQLLSPVLDADSPTSRLYDTRLDNKTGALSFTARFPDTQVFDVRLSSRVVSGQVVRAGKRRAVVLRKRRRDALDSALQGVTSRAQFDCEMTLFRRY